MRVLQAKTAPGERIKALEALGMLGEQARPALRLISAATIDEDRRVRVAAADALKRIDRQISELAVKLLFAVPLYGRAASNPAHIYQAMVRLGDEAEPLTPLILMSFKLSLAASDVRGIAQEVDVLSNIAKKDESACRLIRTGLLSLDTRVRNAALKALPKMQHAATAIPQLIARARTNDEPLNLVAAIEALVILVSKDNKASVIDAINDLRFHPDDRVRRAVEAALVRLQAEP
jgi:HEAT repeat protein